MDGGVVRHLLRGSRLAILDSMLLLLLFYGLRLGVRPPTLAMQRTGILSAYDQAPTDQVLYNRLRWGQIPADTTRYEVLLAVLDCDRIGQEATLQTVAGRFSALVFDCAGVADGGRAWMLDGNYVAEVDYYFWQAHPELVGTTATVVYEASGLQLPWLSWLPLLPPSAAGVGGVYAAPTTPTQPQLHGLAGWQGVDIQAGCGAKLLNPLPTPTTVTYNGLDGYVGPYANGQENTMLTLVSGEYELTLLHGRYLPAVGDKLQKGEPIGFEASIGNSTGCHSHVIFKRDGVILNYLDYLGS